MEIGESNKVYGLSFPTRQPKKEPVKLIESVFKDDSEEEQEEPTFKRLEPSRNKMYQARINRKTKSDLEKALEEDPSVFQYDEVLDDIHSKKDKDLSDIFSRAPKESKYVGRLMKSANERKLERELCAERKAQKEIESERELFKEKESFVTSAYKQKLAELRDLVEKRKQEENREEVMDITKQDGLGGFYRYMFERQTDQNALSQQTCAETTEKEDKSPTEQNKHTLKNSSLPEEEEHHKHHSKRRHEEPESTPDQPTNRLDKKNDSSSIEYSSSEDLSSSATKYSKKGNSDSRVVSEELQKSRAKSDNVTKKVDYGPGFIAARPRVTTDEELEAARERYLARKAAGIHALIVESD